MKTSWNSITASMGLALALISGGWIVNGCEKCILWGIVGLIIGLLFFFYGMENLLCPKIDWRKARRNLSMTTKLWDDRRWVIGYWMQFFWIVIYGTLGVFIYIWGMVVMTYGFVAKGMVVGFVGTGFIVIAFICYKTLCKFVEDEQPKFKRGRR